MAEGTAQWRGKAIVPVDYELGTLVKTARQARRHIVEFEWIFAPDELAEFRRAVHEAGSVNAGRYRVFAACLLEAINNGVGERDSLLSLRLPKGKNGLDCAVSCLREGTAYSIRGHAPFDVVFSYGADCYDDDGWAASLGASTRLSLTSPVGKLGWDVQRLHEPRLRAFWNALYGMPVDYGKPIASAPGDELPKELPVHFTGPFTVLNGEGCCSLFTDPIAKKSGVYLWTIDVGGHARPWYVGQTQRGFGQRMGEHIAGYLSGQYEAADPDALQRGEHLRVPGMDVSGGWPASLPLFLQNADSVMPRLLELFKLIRFHVAALKCSPNELNRVEGALGRWYKRHEDAACRTFLQPGLRVPVAIPGDRALTLLITSDHEIAGLPAEIR